MEPNDLIGGVVGFSALLASVGYFVGRQEFAVSFARRQRSAIRSVARARPLLQRFWSTVQSASAQLGHPEWAALSVQMLAAIGVLAVFVSLLLHSLIWSLPFPLAVATLWVTAHTVVANREWALRDQVRYSRLMMLFLLQAGVSVSDTLRQLERFHADPLASILHQVNIQKRYLTLSGALDDLSRHTGVTDLAEFSALVSEAQRLGTPVAQALAQSLDIDNQIRQAKATARHGQTRIRLTILTTVLIAIPSFGFVLYAMFAFVLHLLSNGMIGL